MTRILTFLLLLAPTSLLAQDIGRPPESELQAERNFPVLELSWYAGHEGSGFQEFVHLDLDEWTPEKDIIITARWLPRTGATAPGARRPRHLRDVSPLNRRLAYVPIHREWIVEYTDAVTEGKSYFFIDAPGLPRMSREIRSADEYFGFVHMPGFGWYEVGAAAKAYRYRTPPEETQEPPVSPSDTQDPFGTRSR